MRLYNERSFNPADVSVTADYNDGEEAWGSVWFGGGICLSGSLDDIRKLGERIVAEVDTLRAGVE